MHILHTLRSIALAATSAWCVLQASAQQNASGIRVTFTHFDNLIKDMAFPPIALGVGFDHDLNEHLAMGVEATLLFRNLSQEMREPKKPYNLEYDGWEAYYLENVRSWGLTYRSLYFPGESSAYAFYIGTSIGVRQIKRQLEITDQYPTSYSVSTDQPFRNKYEASKTVVPIGLRIGLRSDLDGYYGDFYFGVGYQLGGGDALLPQREVSEVPSTLASLTWTLGYAFGFGW